MSDPSQLSIPLDEPSVQQLSLALDPSDPGNSYTSSLRMLFEDTAPWRERRLAVIDLLARAEAALEARVSPRLLYFRARLDDNDEPSSRPQVVVARWNAVNNAWRALLGDVSGFACARIGRGLLECGEADEAVRYLDDALASLDRAVREGRRKIETAAADRQWAYDVRRARCAALLSSRVPLFWADGIAALLRLQLEHDLLSRAGQDPTAEAFAALGEAARTVDAYPRLAALIDILTERCACGTRTFSATGIQRDQGQTILAEATRATMLRDHETAFEVARLLWRDDPARFADLLAATVAQTPMKLEQGVAFRTAVSIGEAESAFRRRDFSRALTLFDAIEGKAPDDAFRVAYWRGQCLRHLGRWRDATSAFRGCESAPDRLLRAWARFRLVECELRMTSVREFFERTWSTVSPYVDVLVKCREDAPNSRRIAFAAACALVATGQPAQALKALQVVDASFAFHRASQWLRCLVALQNHPVEWATAADAIRRSETETAWALPVNRAHEIFELCKTEPTEARNVARAVFDESRDAKADRLWSNLLEEAVFEEAFADKHLLAALDDAFDRALEANEPIAELALLADSRLEVAEGLGAQRLLNTAIDEAKTFAVLGERSRAISSARTVLKMPFVAGIGAAIEAATVLQALGESDAAQGAITYWLDALRGSANASLQILEAFLGIAPATDVSPTPPGTGKRIALFGGHTNQRRACIPELIKLGFSESAIVWNDANDGQGLRFADCEATLRGSFDYYILVTSAIGHATSIPIVSFLRASTKRWWPLAIAGHEGFRTRIAGLLHATAA